MTEHSLVPQVPMPATPSGAGSGFGIGGHGELDRTELLSVENRTNAVDERTDKRAKLDLHTPGIDVLKSIAHVSHTRYAECNEAG